MSSNHAELLEAANDDILEAVRIIRGAIAGESFNGTASQAARIAVAHLSALREQLPPAQPATVTSTFPEHRKRAVPTVEKAVTLIHNILDQRQSGPNWLVVGQRNADQDYLVTDSPEGANQPRRILAGHGNADAWAAVVGSRSLPGVLAFLEDELMKFHTGIARADGWPVSPHAVRTATNIVGGF